VILAMRSPASAPRDAAGADDPATPATEDHDAPVAPPHGDPWAGASISRFDSSTGSGNAPGSLDGDKVAIGQGVEIVMPPGFHTTVQNGITLGLDPRGIMIAAGPIEIASNDPQKLARHHARANGLVYQSMQQIPIAGVLRPMASFHGRVGGVVVRHLAVALIGPGYRVFVAFQAPAQRLVSDQAVQALAIELFARRITVP
jgi:hypothetical protein